MFTIPPFLAKFFAGGLFKLILVAAILGMIGFAWYKIDSTARASEIQKQEIEKQAQQIHDLQEDARLSKESGEVTAGAITSLFTALSELDKVFAKRNAIVNGKIADIKASNLPQQEKERLISKTYITALTDNYCAAKPKQCADGVLLPVGVVAPASPASAPSTPTGATK